MKFGNFEGTPQELKDVCENHGFDPSTFLNTPPRFKPKLWFLVSVVILFTMVSVLIWVLPLSESWLKALTIINLTLTIVSAVVIQLKFNNAWITGISFFGGLLIIAVSLNYITPKEAIKELKEKATIVEKKE